MVITFMYLFVLPTMCARCCPCRYEDTACENCFFFKKSALLSYPFVQAYGKHSEKGKLPFPDQIRKVSICLSNPSCNTIKTLYLSIEMNGKWKVCISGWTVQIQTFCIKKRRSWVQQTQGNENQNSLWWTLEREIMHLPGQIDGGH